MVHGGAGLSPRHHPLPLLAVEHLFMNHLVGLDGLDAAFGRVGDFAV
jgi:hypothetical protein